MNDTFRFVFENLKSAVQDLLNGRVAPADRRAVIADMKRAMTLAKLGINDLRDGVELTRRRLEEEKEKLATTTRRKALAASVPDAETVAIAEKFEAQHAERIAVLERKLEAQEAEVGLAERDYDEMMKGLKSAGAGVGSGAMPSGPSDEEMGLRDDSALNSQLDSLKRKSARSAAEAAADAQLEELKKKLSR